MKNSIYGVLLMGLTQWLSGQTAMANSDGFYERNPQPAFIQKPGFYLQYKWDNVNIVFSVNDVPVKEDYRNEVGGISSGKSVSLYIRPGWNVLQIDFEPIKKYGRYLPETHLLANIQVLDLDTESQRYSIARLDIDQLESYTDRWSEAAPFGQNAGYERYNQADQRLLAEVEKATWEPSPIYPNGIRLTRRFRVNVTNLPRWKWLDSDVISDTDDTRQSLMQVMHRYHRSSQKRDSAAMVTENLEDRYEQALAQYFNVPSFADFNQMAEERKNQINFYSGISEGLQLAPFNPNGLMLRVFGSGRLAELAEWIEGEGYIFPLRWEKRNEDGEVTDRTSIRFIFRRYKKQWIITR